MLYEKSSTCTSDLLVSLNSRSSEEVEMWERPVKSCWGCCSVQSYHRDLLPFCTPSEAAAICKLRCWSETRAKDEVWWSFFGFFCDAVDNHPAVFRRFDERLPAVTVVEAIGVNAAHASRVLLNTKPPSELSPIYICVQCQNLRVQFKLVFVENVNYLIYGRLDVELWIFVLFCWSSV